MCKVLHLVWANTRHKFSLSAEWFESSCEERALGVLVDEKLNMNWQCPYAVQEECGQQVRRCDSSP